MDEIKINMSKELKRQWQFTKDILAGMKDMVRVIDENDRIVFINEPMKKFLGDITGNVCYEALGKCRKCDVCISEMTVKKGMTFEKEEVIGDKIFSVISSPIRDENGEIYCAVEVFRDVTEKRKMERTIVEQNLKMKKDLSFAKYIQERILPKDGVYNDIIKISSKYIPCEMLGGDVYDVVEIDDKNIGIYMADVAGHGVTASMMTMFIKQTLKSLGKKASDPSYTLNYLNDRYNELDLDDYNYITIIYGVFNRDSKEFTLANGGLNCMPIVFKRDRIDEIFLPGLPISSLYRDIQYRHNNINLEPGDKILFYTDGVTESQNSNGDIYGDRIIKICSDNLYKTSNQLLDIILEDVKEYSKDNVRDDIALMIVDIL